MSLRLFICSRLNGHKDALIEIGHPKEFKVSVGGKKKAVPDLNSAIECIFGKKPSSPKKRKTEALE